MLAVLQRNRVVREALIFLAFCGFTAAVTWPYVLHLRDAVADAGDPYFVSWVLWWDYHQTFHDPLNLFHSNLFFPFRYTLAFSEHSYGIALPFFPLYALGFRPLTVHAVALFFAFASTGYGAFRLGRTLAGSAAAGWIAGIAFAFVPFRFSMLSHLQYLFAIWIPLVFEALVLFARERSWKRAIWLGVAFFMSGITCLTWFAFSLVPLAAAAAILLARYGIWRDPNFWRRGAVTLGAAGIALLPFLLPYYIVTKSYHFERSIAEVTDGSARAMQWLAVEGRNRLWRGLGDNLAVGTRFRLFPGSLPVGLAVIAVVRRSRRSDGLWLGLMLAVVGFIYSLGWNSFFYRVLYELLPIFRSIRITGRGAMFAYLGLAVLAGLGAKALSEIISRRSPRLGSAVTCGLATLLLFELNTSRLRIVHGDVEPDAITLRLKETPMRGGIVFLPADAGLNHRRTLRSADHRKPLITGTSGFNSSYQGRIEYDTGSGPIHRDFMKLLEEIPASYLVVENQLVAPVRRVDFETFLARAVTAGRLRYINRFDGHNDLYAVTKTEPDAKSEAPMPIAFEIKEWATLVQEDPVNLLGEYRSVSETIYRLYLAASGTMPRYADFLSDAVAVGRGILPGSLDDQNPKIEENLKRLADQWIQRPQFDALYDGATDTEFVDRIAANAGVTLSEAERAGMIQELRGGAEARGRLLLGLAKNDRVSKKEENRALVLLHYFGYLRRNPDDPPDRNLDGFNFWLKEVESSRDPGRLQKAFLASMEYGERLRK